MGELGRGHLYGPEVLQKVPEGSISVSGTTVREKPKAVKGVCACESQPRNTYEARNLRDSDSKEGHHVTARPSGRHPTTIGVC